MQNYQTIQGCPIIISEPRGVTVDLILVDRGHEFVVANLSKDENGTPHKEWDQGTYFSYQHFNTRKHEALIKALELFRRKAG